MKSYYFGPIEKHPFINYSLMNEFNPAVTCFNFGSGNGWRNCFLDGLIDSSVRHTMNHAVYQNNSDGAEWHANHRRKPNTWIRVGRDNAALMDVSSVCVRGKWGWTNGLKYMDACRQAIYRCDENLANGIFLHIKDFYKTLLATQNQHEFFSDAYARFPIADVWQGFLDNLIDEGIPFVLTDTMWPNVVDKKWITHMGGHEFELEWNYLTPLTPLVKFHAGGEPGDPILWTRRFRTDGPDRFWAAKRITINPNPFPVRNIPPRTGISKFAWVWAGEREQMISEA